jgi:hypothetical protein
MMMAKTSQVQKLEVHKFLKFMRSVKSDLNVIAMMLIVLILLMWPLEGEVWKGKVLFIIEFFKFLDFDFDLIIVFWVLWSILGFFRFSFSF